MTTKIVQDGISKGRLDQCVELLLSYSATVLTSRLLDEVTGGEMTPSQLEALIFLQRHNGCSAKALAEGLHISIPSATRLSDRLVRKGLVDRHESGVDRRLVMLTVTATGVDALAQIQFARMARLEAALQCLPTDDRETLLTLLEQLLRAALRDERTVQDCCLHCGTDHTKECVVNEAHMALLGTPIART